MGKRKNKFKARPEHQAPADEFYTNREAARYTTSAVTGRIQREIAACACDLASVADFRLANGPVLAIDLGCGSCLSGDVLTERGWSWVGVDISEDMLGLAKSKHRGGIACSDLSQGLPIREGTMDVAVSVSAVQWLCYTCEKEGDDASLSRLFLDLSQSLGAGRVAVLQVYLEDPRHVEWLFRAASSYGLEGGLMLDMPHKNNSRKSFALLRRALAGCPGLRAPLPCPGGVGNAAGRERRSADEGGVGEEERKKRLRVGEGEREEEGRGGRGGGKGEGEEARGQDEGREGGEEEGGQAGGRDEGGKKPVLVATELKLPGGASMTLPMCPLAWPHHMCCTAPWRMFWAREGSPRAGEWLETEGGSDLRPLDVLRTLEKAPSDVLPRLLLDKHLKHSKRLCRVFRRALSGFQRGSQGRSWDTRPDAQERDWEGEEGEKDQKPPIADGGRADAGEASTGAREEGRMAWSVSLTVSGFPGCGAPCFATAVGEASPCADKEGALAEGRAGKRALAALLAGAGLRVAGEDETPVEVAVARTAAERDTEKGGALFGEERRGGGQGGRAGGAVLGGTGGRGHDRYKSAAGGEGEGAEVAEGTRAKGGGEGKRKGGKGRGEQPQGLAESADLRPLLARARRELSVGHQALVGAGHGAGDGAAGAGGETCAADAETKLSREGGAAEQSGSHGGKAVAVQAMVMEGTAMHRTLVIELRGNKGSGNGDRSSPSAAALTEELRMLLDRISESGVSSVAGAWVVMGAGQGRPGDPAVLAVYVLSCVPSNCDVERAAHEALGMNWRGVDGST